jgi:hypothetical protein
VIVIAAFPLPEESGDDNHQCYKNRIDSAKDNIMITFHWIYEPHLSDEDCR